ncbi:MAG TPA: hypothetical protein VIM89_07385 [Mucilaginibacter sp.]
MKKVTITFIFICAVTLAFGQDNGSTQQGNSTSGSGNPSSGQTLPNLNGVTFGFGIGYSHTFDKTYDYSLTTDGNHNLQLQPLNKQSFVISSVIMVKLGKIAVDPTDNTIVQQSQKTAYRNFKTNYSYQKLAMDKTTNTLNQQLALLPNDKKIISQLDSVQSQAKNLKNQKSDATGNTFWGRVSIDASLDLANVSSSVTFNKSVNGGLGVGYFITDNLQAALFYDVSRIRQLRDYVVNNYEGKPIPNGSGTNYNALDTSDNNLFYDKTISGLSFKLIFSLANKASTTSSGD